MSIIEALNSALIGTVLVYIKVTFYPISRNEIDILYDFEIEVRGPSVNRKYIFIACAFSADPAAISPLRPKTPKIARRIEIRNCTNS